MAVAGARAAACASAGTAYVQLDDAFPARGHQQRASVRLLSGTYFKVTARSSALAPFVRLTDAAQAFDPCWRPRGP
jgi:hypothetical protein